MQSKGLRGCFYFINRNAEAYNKSNGFILHLNCCHSGINYVYPQSLCTAPRTIKLILGPAQRRAADDVMVSLSASYITGNCL